MLEISGLVKRFKKVTAVDRVSFAARDGEITTLLGANGSGKTTSLRCLVGLLRPDAGRVAVDGIEVAADPKRARQRLGWFPDAFGLYPRLTVREHLRYFARLHGMDGPAMEQAIRAAIAELGMEDIADRRTEGFSTGQSMKVALARALVHAPPNLILDEPTRGLDVMSIRLLRDTLRRLRAEGRCILLSSHVMAEVAELSDRIVCIAGGRTVAEGSPAELVARTGAASLEDAFVQLAA
ncbi:ABC transporter ATP-binding protein [Indioceanicola profundi]|uniref:ABC transporter ATP-binding protein n=1 Tax=Indioceanicola profundi TaxID=2220096 RepID=UPI000E6AB73D|nr:ATP-binding cassette domain-containing protein [Indioceanicola profundi]